MHSIRDNLRRVQCDWLTQSTRDVGDKELLIMSIHISKSLKIAQILPFNKIQTTL